MFDRNNELEPLNRDLMNENETLKDTIRDLEGKVRDLEGDKARLERELENLRQSLTSENARLKDDNARLNGLYQDTKGENKALKDEIRSLNAQIEQLKRDLANQRAALEKEIEERRRREAELKKNAQLAKNLLLKRVMPTIFQREDLGERERAGRPEGESEVKPMEKPRLKAFVHMPREREPVYTHYIAHPCPYCMPYQYGCPLHKGYHKPAPKLTAAEFDALKKQIESTDVTENQKALHTILFHGQADPKARALILEKYQKLSVDEILKTENYKAVALELADMLAKSEGEAYNGPVDSFYGYGGVSGYENMGAPIGEHMHGGHSHGPEGRWSSHYDMSGKDL